MIVPRIVVNGADQVIEAFRAMPPRATARLRVAVRTHAQLLETQVKKNASTGFHAPWEGHIPGTGPGPNVATGDYRRSIATKFVPTLTGATAHIGTDAPQGRRLEFGFVGADSLGRHYNQPPYPHWRPALQEIEPKFVAACTLAVGDR